MMLQKNKSAVEHPSEVLDCPRITPVGNVDASSPCSSQEDSVKNETRNDELYPLHKASEGKSMPINCDEENPRTTTEPASPNVEPSRFASVPPFREPVQERSPQSVGSYGLILSEHTTEQAMKWNGTDGASYIPRLLYEPVRTMRMPSRPRDAVDNWQSHSHCSGVTNLPRRYYTSQYPLPGYFHHPHQQVGQSQETLGRPYFPSGSHQMNRDSHLSDPRHFPSTLQSHDDPMSIQQHRLQNAQAPHHFQNRDPHVMPRASYAHQPSFGQPPYNLSSPPRLMYNPRSISTASGTCNDVFHGEPGRGIYPKNKSHKDPEKKYKCEFCSMGFERPSSLKVHRRRHTKERPFPCDKCEKKFTTASNLTRHRGRLHVQEDPFLEGSLDKHIQERGVLCTPQGPPIVSSRPIFEYCDEGSIRFGIDLMRGRSSVNPAETSAQRQLFANNQFHYRPSHGRSTDQSQTYSPVSRHSSDESDTEGFPCDDKGKAKREKKRRYRSDEGDESY